MQEAQKSAMSPLKLNKAYIDVIVFDIFIRAALALSVPPSLLLPSCVVKVHATQFVTLELIALLMLS